MRYILSLCKLISALFFFLFFSNGCTGKNDGGNIHDGIPIVYTDSLGNPIFQPTMDGIDGYYRDSVLVYDWTNGVKTLLTCYPAPNDTIAYNSPTGRLSCQFDGSAGYIRFRPCYNIDPNTKYCTDIIHLKRGVYDTLKFHVNSLNSNGVIDSIWYNGMPKIIETSIVAISVTK